MNFNPLSFITARPKRVGWVVFIVTLFFVTSALAIGPNERGDSGSDGFTEPYRSVLVAAPEAGIVTDVHIKEGDYVKEGQLLVSLDKELFIAQLEIAEQMAQSTGTIESATAELALRRLRLKKLEQMEQKYASAEEKERARADVKISEANLKSALEEKLNKELDVKRIKVQIERRSVRARLNGVVTKIHKKVGEFVAPNDPVVVTVVQLDPLALTLTTIPRAQAMLMRVDQKVMVRFEATHALAEAQVEHISPVTDAESGTVSVRFKINNPDGRFRSGDRCVLEIHTTPAAKLGK